MRNKVLLVLEDYSELVFWETLLKKVGWDVSGIQNELGLPEKLLTFVPDFIICNAMGSKVQAARVDLRIKRKEGFPKLVLFKQAAQSADLLSKVRYDGILDSPVKPRQLLETLANHGGVDLATSISKLEKLIKAKTPAPGTPGSATSSNTTTTISSATTSSLNKGKSVYNNDVVKVGGSQTTNLSTTTSTSVSLAKTSFTNRYQAIPKADAASLQKTMDKTLVASQKQEFRKQEVTEKAELEIIEKERKDFVKALFQKSA